MKEKEDISFNQGDFGFTFEDSTNTEMMDEQLTILTSSFEELQAENARLQEVNRTIMKRITLLLNSLKGEPDKEVIRWPNRAQNIDQFLTELNNIYKNKE